MDTMHSGSDVSSAPSPSSTRRGRRQIVSGPLSVGIAHGGEAGTIALCGELDLATVEAAKTALRDVLGRGVDRVVIDMSDLTFIDSTGIAFLVAAVREHGLDKLSFVQSSSPAVQRVLKLVGFDRCLEPQA